MITMNEDLDLCIDPCKGCLDYQDDRCISHGGCGRQVNDPDKEDWSYKE